MIRFLIISCLSMAFLSAQDPCAEEIEKVPFPPKIVNKVLEKFKVPPSEWVGINRALDRQVKLLEVQVQQKAAKMSPNPFNPPVQTVVIGRLYRETLIEMFTYVLGQHGIDKKRQIYEMYDKIQDEKAQALWKCRRERGEF